MRILTIGSGGREHALVWALRKTSTRPLELFCAPGNAGIAQDAECRPVAANDIPALVQLVEEKKIDLTIVGPVQSPGPSHSWAGKPGRALGVKQSVRQRLHASPSSAHRPLPNRRVF